MSQGYGDFFRAAKKNNEKPSLSQPVRDKTNFRGKGPRGESADTMELKKLIQNKIDQSKQKKTKKIKRSAAAHMPQIPTGLIVMLVGLAIAVGGLYFVDDIDMLMDGYDIGFVSGAVAAEPDKEKAEVNPESEKKKVPAKPKTPKDQVKEWNEKDLGFLYKLQDRKEQLDAREKEIESVENELKKQTKLLDKKIAKLQKIRREISKTLKERINTDTENVGKLVEFYSNMKPSQAAQVFAEINEDLAVDILGKMKKKNAASIMNLLKPDKARTLSEKFSGYRRPAENN